jgi:hypothetical protein
MSYENIMRLWNDCCTLGGSVRPKLNTIVKTSSYTVTPLDYGSVFTSRGATCAVTFTLPAAGSSNSGDWALFVNVADQNMFVAGPDEGLVVFNDLTADNIGFATTSEKIGGMLLAISDGTSWIVLPIATETQTVNIGTAASSSPSHTASRTASHTVSHTASHTASRTVSHTASHTASRTASHTASHTVSHTASST